MQPAGRRRGMGRAAIVSLVMLGIAQAGCLVRINRVSDPGPLFREARAEALRYAARRGPAAELNVLAWSPGDGELVRVSVPLWLLRGTHRRVDWDELDLDDERWASRMRDIDWEELERSAPGILLEVLEEEGDRVLVWLR